MPEQPRPIPFTEDPAKLDAPVLVTGATGYVGGRLAPALLARGQRVRALARSRTKLACRPWAHHPRVELAEGNLLDYASMRSAMQGCRAAYYLVHSMTGMAKDFAATDRSAARVFRRAAEAARLERVIYLGGIMPPEDDVSHHLLSRNEVAEILMDSTVPATVLRAAQVLGAGSASFEMIRYLVDRLPVMVGPKWIRTEAQPISVGDVLAYLMGVLDAPEAAGRSFDIGGPDVITYRELFDIYAKEAGLMKRLVIPAPVLTPKLSSYWVGFVTPIPPSLGMPLIRGAANRVVCQDSAIRDIVPFEPLSVRETIRRALQKTRQHTVETCWSDAGELLPPEWLRCGDAPYAGGDVLGEAFSVTLAAPVDKVWNHVVSIGGENGWYCGNVLWRLRGVLDRLAGGPGLRRGRRDPHELAVGDALDFWRVLDLRENERLLLLAEMKVPGDALLEFTLQPQGPDRTVLTQTSNFLPRGMLGLAYWWSTYPLHLYIFRGTLTAIARRLDAAIIDGPKWTTRKKGSSCKISF
ncbi:SDR family oxidoreductase [Oceanidesulfovibrio marinus]|uniref:SDR family oxidoreductase n=1 Tax=Oceanidesulfovibrio marinus TaxID=370038 RepID=A0ABX6NGZ9_9BACT|nr:SDR family oxidoreductase [Oceanidesulfovibrio marinus]QJT09917.1 SDR family oxidoreductase [Oceanidesulfovibrio marinus]